MVKYSERIKAISYLNAHAADVVQELSERREPMIITQNGAARLVIQDMESYELTQKTLALLTILVLGDQKIEAGRVVTAEKAFRQIRKRRSWGG